MFKTRLINLCNLCAEFWIQVHETELKIKFTVQKAQLKFEYTLLNSKF